MKNIGRIQISDELVLRWLDFNAGGSILAICKNLYGYLEITIEHPDMPVVQAGDTIPIVSPLYITTQDALGHRVTIREPGKVSL